MQQSKDKDELDELLKNLQIRLNDEGDLYKESLKYVLQTKEQTEQLLLYGFTQKVCAKVILIPHNLLTEDQKTVAYIGARIFNDASVAFTSLMTGYYQASLAIVRDLVEIEFLLDYFCSFPEQIEMWRKASNKERYKNYAPNKLYEKLDQRDGLTMGNRKKLYQFLCEYASHATYPGTSRIAKNNTVIFGGFFDEQKLSESLTMINEHLGFAVMSLTRLMPNSDPEIMKMNIQFLTNWGEQFFPEIVNNPSFFVRRDELLVGLSKIADRLSNSKH